MALDEGIRQRKGMAMGKSAESGGNFGCESFGSANGGHSHPDAGMSHATMPDSARPISGHVARGGGMMPAQAHPDHGPHHHREEASSGAFGVPSLKSENG
jgi:hypothetical protein